jgi:molecular chaperone GrpE
MKEKEAALPKPEEKKQIEHEGEKILPCADRVKELEERLARLQAEFENYKKRVARENEMLHERVGADAILKLLSIVDDFDIAMVHMDTASHKDFKHGIELIYVKLLDMLKKEGVEQMKTIGESFDPYKHDAIRQAEGEDGKVVEVVQKGYMLKGKVLRHAKVVVGKKTEDKK